MECRRCALDMSGARQTIVVHNWCCGAHINKSAVMHNLQALCQLLSITTSRTDFTKVVFRIENKPLIISLKMKYIS